MNVASFHRISDLPHPAPQDLAWDNLCAIIPLVYTEQDTSLVMKAVAAWCKAGEATLDALERKFRSHHLPITLVAHPMPADHPTMCVRDHMQWDRPVTHYVQILVDKTEDLVLKRLKTTHSDTEHNVQLLKETGFVTEKTQTRTIFEIAENEATLSNEDLVLLGHCEVKLDVKEPMKALNIILERFQTTHGKKPQQRNVGVADCGCPVVAYFPDEGSNEPVTELGLMFSDPHQKNPVVKVVHAFDKSTWTPFPPPTAEASPEE